jgi:hypothetical protein
MATLPPTLTCACWYELPAGPEAFAVVLFVDAEAESLKPTDVAEDDSVLAVE